MKHVSINPQEHRITLATEGGNFTAIGFVADLDGFPVSVYPKTADEPVLIVSDIPSGKVIHRIYLSDDDFLEADTKEKALQLFERKLWVLSMLLTDDSIKKIKEQQNQSETMPAPEPIELDIYD